MKAFKQFQLLNGVTAIRVRLGFSQSLLAAQLGVSKSLISMVENKHRSLPAAALRKLSEMEIALQHAVNKDGTNSIQQFTSSLAAIQALRNKRNRLDLTLLQHRLERMREKYATLTGALYNLHYLMSLATTPAEQCRLKHTHDKVMNKLKRCNLQAQAALQGKMAQLEIILAAAEPTQPEAVEQIPAEATAAAGLSPASPQGHKVNTSLVKEKVKEAFKTSQRPASLRKLVDLCEVHSFYTDVGTIQPSLPLWHFWQHIFFR